MSLKKEWIKPTIVMVNSGVIKSGANPTTMAPECYSMSGQPMLVGTSMFSTVVQSAASAVCASLGAGTWSFNPTVNASVSCTYADTIFCWNTGISMSTVPGPHGYTSFLALCGGTQTAMLASSITVMCVS